MTIQLNQNAAPWPLYQQVKNLIMRRITSGQWLPGTKIPSEHELVASLGISRMTINRALRELTLEGHLVRKKGSGTFVMSPKPQFALLEIKSIADEIEAWGGKHHCRVHLLQKEQGSDELCSAMGLKPEAEVYHSILVHYDKDTPIQLAERFVNPKLAPDYIRQDFTKTTPSNYLMEIASVTEVEHIIETRMPDSQTKSLLRMSESEPCLVLHRITWLDDLVVTRNLFIYPGSRYSIGGRFSTSAHLQQITA